MKKIGAVILIFSMLFSLVGCNKQPVGAAVVNLGESKLIKATNFKDVEKYIKKVVKKRNSSGSIIDYLFGSRDKKSSIDMGIVEESGIVNSGVTSDNDGKAEANGTTGGYSDTNTQVQGVDEADIIKTDGKYIYSVINNNMISIVESMNGEMKVVSKITSDNQDKWIKEIFIDEDRLVVIWERNYYQIMENSDGKETSAYNGGTSSTKPSTTSEDKMSILPMPDDRFWNPGKHMASVEVYDTTDITKPVLLKSLEVEGQITSTRKIDGTMYLVASKYCYIYDVREIKEDVIIPYVSEDGNEPKKIDYENIVIFPDSDVEKFTNILTLDIYNTNSNNITSYLTGAGSSMYMNTQSLYLADYYYGNSVKTSISKFSIDGIKVEFVATGEVNGTIINQFAMDEYEDYFRIATTDNQSNGIYVFDKEMKLAGKVDGLAKGEQIYSVRFTGKKAYMVTFKTMDPLFVIDLSNPEKPTVLGELKIPGFSNYMHPISDNTVLGIGRDTVEVYEKDKNGNEIVVGARVGGIKFSLFDVSDPENPVEKDVLIFGDEYSNAEALYNHKAIMVDKERNIFGISVENYNYNNGKNSAMVMLIKATDDGLDQYGVIDIPENDNGWYYNNSRALTIGDYLYVRAGESMYSYSYENLKLIKTIKLN